MFGFSLASQLFQGSAQRTWNCVTQITNLLWNKFNHLRHPIMPRSRRRHHSRSRSRSRSHSHDRDREPKRRKIDNVDSPAHKRSLSCEPRSPVEKPVVEDDGTREIEENENNQQKDIPVEDKTSDDDNSEKSSKEIDEPAESQKPIKQIEEKLNITPRKTLSPKQVQKKLESEKKRQQKQLEREEREKQRQEEKERIRQEKLKVQKEKEEIKNKKAKERELKEEQRRKEKEEKEAKRKEKEEREEAKRKEREQEKLKKQQELEEKNREKQKMEEQKQKAAQAFVNFFVPKKVEVKVEEPKTKTFMPFEVKSDMKLAPARREILTDEEKETLEELMNKSDNKVMYLDELRNGKKIGKSAKTWPYEEDDEDVIIIEEDFGESICEDKQKLKMRAKFLKFHENRRPAYHGTWRKKSVSIKPRRPFGQDKVFFDYEVDSDDDWEEEEQGESLNGSDDEDKENEVENDDYEVDNEFFVPHGHLSDDEVDDEAVSKLSPESHKQKLKLLKDEFDQDMQTKTNKLKPRSIGCIWYNKDGSNVEEAIDRHLRPLAMITNGQVIIKKRKDPVVINASARKYAKELCQDLIPAFLKHINQNSNRKSVVVEDFINYMQNNNYSVEVSKAHLVKRLKEFAQWKKCLQEGSMFNKYCWVVEEDVKKKYNVE